MKKILTILLAIMLLFSFAACNSNGEDLPESQQTESNPDDGKSSSVAADPETPPDPKEDYTAFYEYLLGIQSAGKIPFEDKLVAEGEVTDKFSLTIGGKTFDNAVAEELTVYTATFTLYTKVEGHDNTWVGYRFTEVCDLLGLKLGDSIKLHATDGFSQTFDVKNIDDNTMIAIAKDGDPADGPYFAPCTYLISANYTKFLSEIDV